VNQNLAIHVTALLNMGRGISLCLLIMLATLPIQALSSERAGCTAKEIARILNLNEPKGRGRILAASEVSSSEGASWLIKRERGRVIFLRRTDYGESGKMQTDYLFLRKDMFLAKQETYAYAEPIYVNKAVAPKLTRSELFVMCKGQAWISVGKAESMDAQKMREPWDIQSKIGAPELAGMAFGID
jgi:hypothetical protein